MLLAESWDNSQDLAGWWMSEKLSRACGRIGTARSSSRGKATSTTLRSGSCKDFPAIPLDGVTANGAPAGNVLVEAISTITNHAVAWTAAPWTGAYSLTGLYTGTYRGRFTLSGYTTRYSGSTSTAATAPVVTVTDGAGVVGVNTNLSNQSTITGNA